MVWAAEITHQIDLYKKKLGSIRNTNHLSRFEALFNKNEESAISEAIVFNWLECLGKNPCINENDNSGGPDFLCNANSIEEFLVEVTCLGSENLQKATGFSGLPGQHSAYRLPVAMVKQRISDKTPQLSGYDHPRILVITSLHRTAGLLFNEEEIPNYFASESAIKIPLNSSFDEATYVTNLKHAIFFRFNKTDGIVEPCRQSISAVFFVVIYGNGLTVRGVVHPEPNKPLDHSLFPEIPFLFTNEWPPRCDQLELRWIGPQTYSFNFPDN